MSTARPTLEAANREVTGKAVSRLRREGLLPAVVFGHGVDSANVTVDQHSFEVLRRSIGPNALVDLTIDGRKPRPVLIHGVQHHPVTRAPLHVDLFVVRMTEELIVDVPLVPVGSSIAVDQSAGTLIHPIESVKVKALPDHLPQSIEYSVESLVDFDSVIFVRDLPIPGDVTLLTDTEEVIARVLPPRIEHEPVVAEEGEEGEAEAGEGVAEAGAGAAEDAAAEG
jgi:large subunit ribosomal protein L25